MKRYCVTINFDLIYIYNYVCEILLFYDIDVIAELTLSFICLKFTMLSETWLSYNSMFTLKNVGYQDGLVKEPYLLEVMGSILDKMYPSSSAVTLKFNNQIEE